MIFLRQTYGPQEGNWHPQDSPHYMEVTALVCPRKFSHGFGCPALTSLRETTLLLSRLLRMHWSALNQSQLAAPPLGDFSQERTRVN